MIYCIINDLIFTILWANDRTRIQFKTRSGCSRIKGYKIYIIDESMKNGKEGRKEGNEKEQDRNGILAA